MNGQRPLEGARIVVTRPEGRGESLCERIEAAGGKALFFPVIEIIPLPEPRLPDGHPDVVIFASQAAVEHGLARVRERFTSETGVAAIGSATARALQAQGVAVDVVPEQQESEGLLSLPAFSDMTRQAAWIVRGRGGRELMPNALEARGAEVALIEVYERRIPATDTEPLLAWWREKSVHAIVVTSRAGLENLHAMLDAEGRAFLGETQLVMPTERMIKLALEFDVRPAPVIAEGASDDALMAALAEWWCRAETRSN